MNSKQKGWLLVRTLIVLIAGENGINLNRMRCDKMTNREKLISHYTKWLKSLDDRDLVFTIELCAETEFCCKHCVFSNKGKQCGSTTDSYIHDNYTNDSYTDDNACVDGIRAWLEQE